jgi:hypothetical protein
VTFDDRLYAYLTQLPTLQPITGARVFPVALPQGGVVPAITYQQISGTNPYRSQTDEGPEVGRYRLSCWGKTLEDANRVRDAIVEDFKAGGGPAGSNVRDGGGFDQDPQTLLFHRRLEVLFSI